MGFALRYKLENLARYGKQGTGRQSEYRGYSHGLKSGIPVYLTSYGSLSAVCVGVSWLLKLCAESLITENRLPAFLVTACGMLSMLPFSTLFFGFFSGAPHLLLSSDHFHFKTQPPSERRGRAELQLEQEDAFRRDAHIRVSQPLL